MKKIASIILVVLGATMIFSACKKYEEGPSFTLVTAKKRIVGLWILDEARLNDVKINFNDLTSLLGNYDFDDFDQDMPIEIDLSQIKISDVKLNIKKENEAYLNFEITYGLFPVPLPNQKMDWKFSDDKNDLILTADNQPEQVFKILKLTKEELWLQRIETNLGRTDILLLKFEK